MTVRRVLLILVPSLLLVAFPGPVRADGDRPWTLELGAMFGHHNNFFFRGPGSPAPEETLFTVYAAGEKEKRVGRGKVTLLFDAGAIQTEDIAGADHYRLTLGGEYKRGATKLTGEYFSSPNRVYFEDAEGIFYDLSGVELGVRRGLKPGLWVGAEVEIERLSFDAAERGRDATARELAASIRFPLGARAGLRLTAMVESRDAELPQYDLTGTGAALALEAQPSDRVHLFARYKRRNREYQDAPAGTSNFQRDDTVDDIVVNLRWQVQERWGLRLETFHREGESNRIDRNYDGTLTSVGVFYLF